MAKKKISKEDIAPKDLFKNIIDGAAATKTQIDLLTKSVNALKTASKGIKKDIGVQKVNNTKGQKDFNALQKQANATAKAKLQIDKQLLHQKARLSQQQKDENKAIRTTVEATSSLTTIQKKSLGTLQKLELSSRKLRAERAKLNLDTKKGAQRLTEINQKLDQNNAKIRASGDAMKKQRLNIGNYTGAMGGMVKMLGMLGGAFAVFRLAKGAFNIVRNFEQSQADLASVLGVTVDGMSALTNQARELGASTRFTAGEVASLQKEYAKLGFDQTEIEKMTESTLQLAAATGTELPRAAEVVGATLRGFGMDSSETQRVVDVMAKSFTSSSLDMEKFATSMSAVAPVAKVAGLSVEKTTALLGTLTDRGLDASTAGTGLRNIFLELSKRGMSFEEAMGQINKATDKNAASLELFGKRGATVGTILSETSVSVSLLEAKLKNAGGAAKEMADKQLNTLNGQIDLLKSAWEGFILDLEQGTGAFEGLKRVISFLGRNLTEVIKIMALAVTVITTYKVVMLAGAAATKLYRIATIGFTIVQALLTGNTQKATAAMRLFNIAVKLNPLGLLLTLIAASVTAYYMFADRTSQAAKEQKRFNEQVEAGKEASDKLVDSLRKQVTEKQRLIGLDLTKGLIEEEEAVQMNIDLLEEEEEKILDLIIAKRNQQDEQEEQFATERNELKKYWAEKNRANNKGNAEEDENFKIHERKLRKLFIDKKAILEADVLALKENRTENQKLIDEANAQQIATEIGVEEEIDDSKKAAYEKRKQDLALYLIRLQDLRDAAIVIDLERLKAQLKRKFDREIEAIKGNSKTANELRTELKLQELREIAKLEDDWRKKRAAEAYKTTLTIGKQEEEQLKESIILKKIAADKELALQVEIAANKPEDVNVDELERLLNERYDLLKRALEDERDLLLLNDDLSPEERDLIDIQFDNKFAENERNRVKAVDDANNKIIEAQQDFANKKKDINKDEVKDTEKTVTDMAKLRNQAVDTMTSYFIAKADERIAKLDEEISAHQKQADFLKQLAMNGNIEAKDSLAEENRLIAEAEQKKAEEEKRKQQIMMVSAILKAYVSNLDAGQNSTVALGNAIASKSVLDAFIAGIGNFFEGTEDTGVVSNPLDSNGGRLAVLHNNERVLTAQQNKKIGGYSNEQVASIVEQNRMGKLAGNSQIGSGWDSQLVVKQLMKVESKLDAVNKTIENKEVSHVELGAITQTSMNIVERRKKAGNRTISTYKVEL